MKNRKTLILISLAGVFLIYFTYLAVRAGSNLVTLNVRDMEVRKVMKKIAWQTWEIVQVHKNVEGKVTLNVTKMPLEDVLKIIGEQTSSRWSAIYPLYGNGSSLANLRRSLRGEISPEAAGWTNLNLRPRMGRMGRFGENARSANDLVTANVAAKPILVASRTLERFGRIQVVPEDGPEPIITLFLNQTPLDEAIEQLADKAERKWTKLYTLQDNRMAFGGPGRRGPGGRRPGDDPVSRPTNAEPRESNEERQKRREELRAERERQFQEQLETMSPEDQEKALAQREREQQFRQMRDEMRNLPPDQRRDRMAEMARDNPAIQNRVQERMLNGIKNRTPEQRVERDQQFAERRRAFEQRGN